MKKLNYLLICTAFLGILISCAKDQPSEQGGAKKRDLVNISKSALEVRRSVKISNTIKSKVDNYIDRRIRDIQKNHVIDRNGVIVLSHAYSADAHASSNLIKSSKFYEIITVKSGDGKTKGFLWNFYGTNYRSFYQELKFDSNGEIEDFILWSEYNKPFFTTEEGKYTTSMSSDGEDSESWWECTARVFQAAQQACEADPTCNLACSVLPTCEASMAAAAAAACAIN